MCAHGCRIYSKIGRGRTSTHASFYCRKSLKRSPGAVPCTGFSASTTITASTRRVGPRGQGTKQGSSTLQASMRTHTRQCATRTSCGVYAPHAGSAIQWDAWQWTREIAIQQNTSHTHSAHSSQTPAIGTLSPMCQLMQTSARACLTGPATAGSQQEGLRRVHALCGNKQ